MAKPHKPRVNKPPPGADHFSGTADSVVPLGRVIRTIVTRIDDDPPQQASMSEAEFDSLMARAGIAIPEDRRPALLAACRDLHAALALLKDAEAEPAHAFRPDPLDGP
jgi:hypothetical protein